MPESPRRIAGRGAARGTRWAEPICLFWAAAVLLAGRDERQVRALVLPHGVARAKTGEEGSLVGTGDRAAELADVAEARKDSGVPRRRPDRPRRKERATIEANRRARVYGDSGRSCVRSDSLSNLGGRPWRDDHIDSFLARSDAGLGNSQERAHAVPLGADAPSHGQRDSGRGRGGDFRLEGAQGERRRNSGAVRVVGAGGGDATARTHLRRAVRRPVRRA